jgi:ATP synthase protein I
MSDQQPVEDPTGEDARVGALDTRLRAAREREGQRTASAQGEEAKASYQLGNRVLAELLGGIGGGALIGWVIDQFIFAGKSHWGLVVVMMLGIFVAFRNIFRISSRPPE